MDDIADGIPGALLIAADDIDDAEEQISAAFNTIRIKTVGPGHNTRIRVWRSYAGVLGIDDVDYSFDMTYHMDAPDQILLCRMLSGIFEETHYRQPTRRHGIGAAMAFGAIPHPVQGRVEKARYHMVSIPRPTLALVAADHPDSDAVRLLSTTPWSEAANQYVVDVVDHLRFGAHPAMALPQAPQRFSHAVSPPGPAGPGTPQSRSRRPRDEHGRRHCPTMGFLAPGPIPLDLPPNLRGHPRTHTRPIGVHAEDRCAPR